MNTFSANAIYGRSLIRQSIRQELQTELRTAASAQFKMGAIPCAMIQPPQSAQVKTPVVSELDASVKP